MSEEITRRELLRLAALSASAFGLERLGLGVGAIAEASSRSTLAVARNQSPAAMVKAAVGALGGMKRFIRPGGTVVIKPNAAWAQPPSVAANTNPEVVAEIVRLCKEAGARVVKVMDNPCDSPPELVFNINGIRKATEAAGGIMISGRSESLYQPLHIPRGKVLKNSQVLRDVMKADLFINVPIAKVHGSVPVTLSMKNLMGVTFDRGAWHNSPDLNQAIADYSTVVRPHLIIMDGVRALLSNGPKGPGRTKDTRMIIAGTDPVAVDAFTAQEIFGLQPARVRYITLANAAGVGEMDLKRISVKSA